MSTKPKGWIQRTALLAVLAVLLFPGCNKLEEDTTASSYLVVTSLTGNDLDGTAGSTVMYSDVITGAGSIYNDNAVAVLEAHSLDPFDVNLTTYKDIIVERVDVEFTRTDGLNTEGVDVPYAFSQEVNVLVQTEGSVSDLEFQVITHNAKLESPLVGLVNIGGEKILKLEAHCTFYGRTVSGYAIAPVTRTISVWCANFADSETGDEGGEGGEE